MTKRILQLSSIIAAGMIFSSCASSTPQSRIDKNPEQFAKLSTKDQERVTAGQIAKGMSPEAVFLAWGNPSSEIVGFNKDESYTEWRYYDYRTAPSNVFYGSIGYGRLGYSKYGRRGYGSFRSRGVGYGLGIGSTVTTVPELNARVWFKNLKVESWEKRK